MLPRDLLKRLAYIKGQIGGVEKMLLEGADPEKIAIQFKASENALRKAHFLLLDEVFRKGLALQLVEVMNACPGNCGEEDTIQLLKKKFPRLELEEITGMMKEVEEISKRMNSQKDGGAERDFADTPEPEHLCPKQKTSEVEKPRKKVEIFTAGCPVCIPLVEWVTSSIAEDCDLTIYDVVKQCETKECLSKAVEYGIKALPAVALNGKLLNCCQPAGVSREQLLQAGILRTTL